MQNLILNTDSYKVTHWKQYPPNTEVVHSYFESRGGDFEETVFFGLQYILEKHLSEPVYSEHIDDAQEIFKMHFGTDQMNVKGWDKLVEKHDGYLPIRIRAVPEGTVVPVGNVLMTVENTDPDFWWLTSYLETLLVQVWYPTTIATNSRECKKIIKKFLEETGDPEGLPFKLHDFGFRGVTCQEQAAIGGAAHLVNFLGTDTMAAFPLLSRYYGAGLASGFSIPASEHSTITAWGKDNEYEAFANMLKQYPEGLVACVSDSYNIYEAAKAWGTRFKEDIMNRNGTLVVRPDSGWPPTVVVQTIKILGEYFGYTLNMKGFKVLPPQIRVIQGDGIDRQMIKDILTAMKAEGWSADNIAFGSGGGLLQKFDRDTCKFAFKASAIKVDGKWRDNISKDPVTDPGKKSKAGRLALILSGRDANFSYKTVPKDSVPEEFDLLETVYENGDMVSTQTLEHIRERAKL